MTRYQNQSMSELNFYLLETENLPDGIEVLQHKRLHQSDYQLDLRVVSTSHALSIRTPFAAITEIVACSTIDNMQKATVCGKRLHESGGEVFSCTNLRYTIDWEIQRYTPGDFLQRCRQLNLQKNAGIYYEFPRESTGVEHPAVTLIECDCQAKRIRAHTCHTYPNEFGMVTTQTQIEMT